jgi:hypothetical protein
VCSVFREHDADNANTRRVVCIPEDQELWGSKDFIYMVGLITESILEATKIMSYHCVLKPMVINGAASLFLIFFKTLFQVSKDLNNCLQSLTIIYIWRVELSWQEN